tara:strand:- start:26 stop:502 length:477 start_codon:yes stop_codon:yes gene_type:complete
MAGEKYIDLAVVKLAAFLNTNLATKLRAVETAQSLTTDSLTDPVGVLTHRAPFDNRSPLIEVFDEGWSYIDLKNKLLSIDCTVAVTYIGDANISGGETFMRRYMTAVLDTIMSDPTLGATVVKAVPTDGSSAVSRGDHSMTRHIFTQGVDVHVYHGGS